MRPCNNSNRSLTNRVLPAFFSEGDCNPIAPQRRGTPCQNHDTCIGPRYAFQAPTEYTITQAQQRQRRQSYFCIWYVVSIGPRSIDVLYLQIGRVLTADTVMHGHFCRIACTSDAFTAYHLAYALKLMISASAQEHLFNTSYLYGSDALHLYV